MMDDQTPKWVDGEPGWDLPGCDETIPLDGMAYWDTQRESDSKPVIRVIAGDLHKNASAAETGLIAGAAPFYVRGGLVRPIIDDLPATHGRRALVPRLKDVDCDTLIDHLSRSVRFERFDGRSSEWVQNRSDS